MTIHVAYNVRVVRDLKPFTVEAQGDGTVTVWARRGTGSEVLAVFLPEEDAAGALRQLAELAQQARAEAEREAARLADLLKGARRG